MGNPAARITDGLLHSSVAADIVAGVLDAVVFGAAIFAVGALVAFTFPAWGAAATAGGLLSVAGFGLCAVSGIVVGVASALTGAGEAVSSFTRGVADSLFPPGVEAFIITGSGDVFTNQLKAARAAFEIVPVEPQPSEAPELGFWEGAVSLAQEFWRPTVATAAPGTSPLDEDKIDCNYHSEQFIAEGSQTVFINGHPAARSGDRSTCEATIGQASPNVFIGGPSIVGRDIKSQTSAGVTLGIMALGLLVGKAPWSSKIASFLPCLGIGVAMAIGTSRVAAAVTNSARGGPNPVHASTGIKILDGDEDLDFVLQAPMPLAWQRRYNSRDDAGNDSLFGWGWRTDFECTIEFMDDADGVRRMTYRDEQGRPIELDEVVPGKPVFSVAEGLSFRTTQHGVMLVESIDGLYRGFEPDPLNPLRQRLAFLSDRNRNELRLIYDPQGRLTHVYDSTAHQVGIHFHYDAAHTRRVTRIDRLIFGELNAGQPIDEGSRLILRAGNPAHDQEHKPHTGHRHQNIARPSELHIVSRELLVDYVYDPEGDLAQVRNALGDILRRFAYDDARRMIMHQLPTGNICRYEWQPFNGPHPERGLEWRVSRYWSDQGDEYRFEYVFNKQQNQGGTRITDGLGRVSTRHWRPDYQITYHQDEAGQVWQFEWDDNRQLTQATDPQGGRWAYGYDDLGHLVSQADPLGQVETTVWNTYWSLPKSEKDASGARWFYQYDACGNLISETDPLGQLTRYEVNRQGLVTSETDALGKTRQMRYNALGQLIEHVDCTGSVTHFHYDARGHLSEVVDAQGNSTLYGHDVLGLLKQVRLSDGREEHYGRNAAGQLTHHVNAAGQSTHYHYRSDGLLRQRVDASGHAVTFDHDAYLRLLKLSNENNEAHSFEYDAVDQVTLQRALDGSEQRYRHDALGNIVEVAYHPAPMGTGLAVVSAEAAQTPIVHQLERDAVGQLVRKTTADGSTHYRYDKRGQLLQVRFEPAKDSPTDGQTKGQTPGPMRAHSLSFQYDALGRLIQEDNTAGSLKHQYDALGNLLSSELPDGRVLQRLYYGSGHLHQIRLDETVISDFERDALHREVLRTQGRLHQKTHYDKTGRIQQRQRWLGAGALQAEPGKGWSGNYRGGATQHNGRLLSEQDYRWSAADELVGIDRKEYIQPGQMPQGLSGAGAARQHPLKRVHQILSYGPTGLLQGSSQIEHRGSADEATGQASAGTPLTRETFHYDRAANLLGAGAGASAGGGQGLVHHNKVLVFEDKRYRYDAFGRLLEKRSSRHGQQRFEYDAEHRLIAVHQRPERKRNSTQEQSQAGSTTRFEYDALGRRIAKTHQESNEAGHQSRPRITRFGWDGMRLLSETREPLFEQQAQHHSLYIYEDEGSYEPLARVDGENKVLHFHNDLSGKPEALSSAEHGQVIWRASYKVWGNTVSEEWSGEYAQVDARTVAQNIRFQGQYLDPETGLHYNTFRYYDPDIGRFTTPDPIGLNGGLNLYQYAPNPISWVDPWGWCSAKLGRSLGNRPKNSAAHHIVGDTSKRASLARGVLTKHKIDIDSKQNGVWLPNRNNSNGMGGILHNGKHPNAYFDKVNARIIAADKAGGKQGVLNELSKIQQELSSAPRVSDWSTVLGN